MKGIKHGYALGYTKLYPEVIEITRNMLCTLLLVIGESVVLSLIK
jgi:hypothetical protein